MADVATTQPVESPVAAGNTNETNKEMPAPVTPRKRAPAAPKLDADGNPIPKTPRKNTPKAKVDADGKPLPKTPRKAATPKVDADGNPIAKTPKKTPAKAKAAAKTESSQEEGSGGDSGIALNDSDEVDAAKVALPATPGSKKRGSTSAASAETPSKRVKGNALPTCKAELSEQDKMMMEWKDAGKSWGEIKEEYARITGKPVGNSTLPVRYGRLKASLVELKEGDMERVLIAKDIINKLQVTELEAFKKKQETEAWGRIAAHIVTIGADTYTGEAIQKAYAKEKKDNFPHMQTELYVQFLSGDGLKMEVAAEEADASQEAKDDIDVDFDENGEPVYTKAGEAASQATTNGSTRKESQSDESTAGETKTTEDDGAVFN